MKKVYIAGKLNDDAVGYIHNVHWMIMEAEKVRKAGYAVFVPCLDFLMGVMFGYWQYEDYFNNSQPFLASCDYLYACPNWKKSEGTKKEMAYAKELGIPIVYSIEQLFDLENNPKGFAEEV